MLDFEIMDKALKIAWIERITEHDDAAWTVVPEFAAAYYGGLSYIIECPPTSENRILDYGFTKEKIHKVYTFAFLITKDSKLIAFQYNIMHHISPTKSSLFRAGITESDTCTLYKTEN